jgi:hypothetical protein
MELSPARQKLLFLVIVVVLAVIGYYVVLPGLKHHNAAAPATATVTGSPSQPSAPTYSAAPVATQSPNGPVNIYSWLPFTEAGLATAAAVTTRFCVDYDTYTYTESASAYVGKMSALMTSGLASILQEGYTTPGTAALRTGKKEISSGTATITSLRAFGQTSLIFVVNITQNLVSSGKTSSGTTPYAVTVTDTTDGWQVSDIELASLGNT